MIRRRMHGDSDRVAFSTGEGAAPVRRICLHSTPSMFTLLLAFFCLTTHCADVFVEADGSFSHTVTYGSEECILFRIPKDGPYVISGSFDCLDTKLSPDAVKVALYNGYSEEIWASEKGQSEGTFSIVTPGTYGKHWLCLENGYDHMKKEAEHAATGKKKWERVARTIGFSIRVKSAKRPRLPKGKDKNDNKDKPDPNEDPEEVTERLVDLMFDLNENFQDMVDHMSFMKAREIVHRELHEETFTKVVMWNILELCTVVLVTFGQVMNVWWILSKRRTY